MTAVERRRRDWSDALLGRPWLLVAAVAVLVALPVLVLGQASENDTRASASAAKIESAVHSAQVISSNFNDRTALIGHTFEVLAGEPRPETSPIGLAVQHDDVAGLRAITESVQRLYPRYVLRTYIATWSKTETINEATIVAASPAGLGLVGRRLSDPAPLFGSNPQLRPTYTSCVGFSDAYPGTTEAPSRVELSVPTPQNCPIAYSSVVIVAEVDLARTFADFSAPFLAGADDAYLLNGRRQLIGRARASATLPFRDLSSDPFVKLVGPPFFAVARDGAADPLGGGSRVMASAGISGSDWSVVVVRDTSITDREIDAVLGQLATARYVLVALVLVGAFLVAQAASAQIRQRRALAVANAQTEAASLHKSAFLANMSHELRTPLNSINGFSDVLLTGIGGTLSEKQREYLTDIRGSGEHLLALVNDVLDLSKVEAGKMDLSPTQFDIADTIDGVHRTVAPLAQHKRQRLKFEVDGVGAVRADQARLRQVLLNVLSNAVKYTPEGGSITTTAVRRDGTVAISVRDSGVGIAPQDQARVFDDFTRIDAAYVRDQQGTGLGLSLARRLARLMGGDITLESAPGEGSTFTITVPAA